MRVPIPTIELDAHGWCTVVDVIDAIIVALGGPVWHGRGWDALHDSMVGGDINGIEPPYAIVIKNTGQSPSEVQEAVRLFVKMVGDWRTQERAEISARFED